MPTGGNQRVLLLFLSLDPHDQMRRPALFHEEGVDPAAGANQRDVAPGPHGDGLDIGEVGRAAQVPVVGIAHHEVEDLLLARQNQHRGVPNPGPDFDDPVLLLGDAQHPCAFLGVLRRQAHIHGEAEPRKQNSCPPVPAPVCIRPENAHRVPPCSASVLIARFRPYCSTARALFSASRGEEV